jgi:hypothetical protein
MLAAETGEDRETEGPTSRHQENEQRVADSARTSYEVVLSAPS